MRNDRMCAQYHDLLLLLAQDQLPASQRAPLEQHLSHCQRCTEELAQWRATRTMLASATPQPEHSFAQAWSSLAARLPVQPPSQADHNHVAHPDALLLPPRAARTPHTAATYTAQARTWVSVVVVILLFGGVLAWIAQNKHHTLQASPTVTPTASLPTATPLPGCQAPPAVTPNARAVAQGVTVSVVQSYADATHTELLIQRNAAVATDLGQLQLTDSCGHNFDEVVGGSFGAFANGQAIMLFAPLPSNLLQFPARLTLTISTISAGPGQGENLYPNTLAGPWTITFAVQPHVTGWHDLHIAATTHDGLSIKPTTIGWTNSAAGIDGLAGGVMIKFHLSGLALTVPANPLIQVGLQYGFAYVSGSVLSANGALGTMRLTLPNGASPPLSYVVFSVGANGEADMEAMYFNTTLPTTGTAQLSVNFLPVNVLQRTNPNSPWTIISTHTYNGPWSFQIPID